MVVLPGLAPPDEGAQPAEASVMATGSVDAPLTSSDTKGLEKARDSGRAMWLALAKNADPVSIRNSVKIKGFLSQIEVF